MAEVVKRGYRSDVRTAQARETRRRIIRSASELFVAAGYGATSVDAIAEGAGVSRKTVFNAVGGKAEILAMALDWAVAGDDEPIPLMDRPDVAALLRLDDPGQLLDAWAAVIVDIDSRVADLYAALEAAAGVDSTAHALFTRLQSQRREGAQVVVDAVVARKGVRHRLLRAEAADLACLFSEPLMYRRLVGDQGWSVKRFERWLRTTLREQLLRT
ncbi:helix-turn-helix domain containing protein [Mycolicibacterium sp. BiH015]|uniref:TetR/AcrR family transcriptional regulator n=1 Tax=Mycolicibacterium sp. BiH015 TaxID=3018808 RepID=UPI0022E51E11|nr:helix-turn-helix domain-containing protein [Mycolicibacterium sp. BiH015]MDA2890716.1 helix-turn-helix domain containing protein [Mycolicibacterium sp. BiH015]